MREGRHIHPIEDTGELGFYSVVINHTAADRALDRLNILQTDIELRSNAVQCLGMAEHLRVTGVSDPVRSRFSGLTPSR